MKATDLEQPLIERLRIAFCASLINANAGMKWLDHDSMDEMIEAAWIGFEQPAIQSTRIRDDALPADIAEAVSKMGKVEWGAVGPKSDDEHASDFRDSLFETRVNHRTEGDQQLHGLYLEGTETVLCHTGTSPNSANNARALAGAWNWLVTRAALTTAQERKG